MKIPRAYAAWILLILLLLLIVLAKCFGISA